MASSLIFITLLEVFYLVGSFLLSYHYGQWSFQGEIYRTLLRGLAFLPLLYYCWQKFQFRQPTVPFQSLSPLIKAGLMLLFGFAVLFSNGHGESVAWQILFVCSGVLAGFREELYYRGIVQSYLQEKFSVLPALLLSTTVFSLAHFQYFYYGQFYALTLITLAGLVFGILFIQLQNIWLVSLVHALYDALLSIAIFPFKLNMTASLLIMLFITLFFLVPLLKDQYQYKAELKGY